MFWNGFGLCLIPICNCRFQAVINTSTKLNKMKNNWYKKGLSLAIVAAVALVSCKKNDIDEKGMANVKIVNAANTSTDQGFYLAGKVVVQGGLAFGETSDGYISVSSGNNLELQFRNDGSATGYATTEHDLDKNKYYTIFLAGEGQTARVKVYEDNLSAPTSGKAKIRFVHLSNAAPDHIDIRTSSGTNLVVNLKRDDISNYIEVDPSVMSLQVFATGQSASLGTFDLSAFAAGKIYTVYVTGSTGASIQIRQVVHN